MNYIYLYLYISYPRTVQGFRIANPMGILLQVSFLSGAQQKLGDSSCRVALKPLGPMVPCWDPYCNLETCGVLEELMRIVPSGDISSLGNPRPK